MIIISYFLHVHVFVVAICRYNCGGSTQGTCVSPDKCSCKDGFTGTFCTSGKFKHESFYSMFTITLIWDNDRNSLEYQYITNIIMIFSLIYGGVFSSLSHKGS